MEPYRARPESMEEAPAQGWLGREISSWRVVALETLQVVAKVLCRQQRHSLSIKMEIQIAVSQTLDLYV